MSHIRIEVDGAVGHLIIDRRERFNSLDVETARDLRRAGIQLARDEQIRAVVLRGTGGVFCSGADLKYIRAGGASDDLGYLVPPSAAVERPEGFGAIFKQILEYLHSTISEIRRSAKPWIAAVDGAAAAGGLGLAMCCDLVVASERSTFEWAYGKTGLTGAESSTFLLPKLVGLRRALELAFLNPRLNARAAMEWGLVTRVFPDAMFEEGVRDIAATVAAGPTQAFAATKRLMNQSAGIDRLDPHLDQEIEQLAAIADGANFREGITAFFEKRPAMFGVK